MKNLNPKVKEYLESLEQEKNFPIPYEGEIEISDKIRNILNEDETYKATKYDTAEHAAFGYFRRSPNSEYSWGTHYGPLIVLHGMEYPSLQWVDKEVLAYWAERAKESKNPILSSRYADLVVDFSQKIIGEKANSDMFQIVINSNITICEKQLANFLDCQRKIRRVLDLAIEEKDKNQEMLAKDMMERIEQVLQKYCTPQNNENQ